MKTTESKAIIANHIEITPGVCGGKPRIAGHRIKVQHIVMWHERMGWSPDEILAHFPALALADVYAALAYYWDHKNEIDADFVADDEFIAQRMKESGPSLLAQKMGKNLAGTQE